MNPNDQGFNNLIDFCEIFYLTNLINFDTCVTKIHSSSVDVILTNREGCFKDAEPSKQAQVIFTKWYLRCSKGVSLNRNQ